MYNKLYRQGSDMVKTRRKRRGRRRTGPKAFWVVVVALAVFVVMGAVWITMSAVGSAGNPNRGSQRHMSDIQDKLDALPWVSQEFLTVNRYSRPGIKLTGIGAIVIHYIGNPGTTAEQNRNYFDSLSQTGETYASSNFLIGIDGEIIQLVPCDEIAYCSNSRNIDTLSIECCHPDETGKFSDATYASLVRLTAWLCGKFGLSTGDLLRHYDVSGKICPKYYVDRPDMWDRFLSEVANATSEQTRQA